VWAVAEEQIFRDREVALSDNEVEDNPVQCTCQSIPVVSSLAVVHEHVLGGVVGEHRGEPMACYQVGGIPTPLKNMSSSVGIPINNIWENKKWSKPPTSSYIVAI